MSRGRAARRGRAALSPRTRRPGTRVRQRHEHRGPQISIDRAAAIVRTPGSKIITLLNPQIIDQSGEQDEQYEGCLSFFDVRGKVPRPLRIQVEHQHVDGSAHITVFERGVARLVSHEIDHLAGVLYTDRMADSASVIPVEQYRGGQSWQYA